MFILPQSVLQEVDKNAEDSCGEARKGTRKIALVSWDKVCVPKTYGGLNIKRYNYGI